MATVVRAVRGATTVDRDDEVEVRRACHALFSAIVRDNDIDLDDVISVIVTTTADITSIFPARALREECGLDDIPLLGALEAPITGGLPLAIRVLVHVNTDKSRGELTHVFQGGAVSLRPDIAPAPVSPEAGEASR